MSKTTTQNNSPSLFALILPGILIAATGVGAIWSSCSPDFGTRSVLDRFGQIEPHGRPAGHQSPHPLGMHGGVWSLLTNWIAAWIVTRGTAGPDPANIERIHGALEDFAYGEDPQ